MKRINVALAILAMFAGMCSAGSSWSAQQPQSETIPVSIVVSVEARHGKEIPAVTREDVRVLQGHDRLRVTDWIPLEGAHADLDLLVLIDEATGSEVATQFGDLRQFMNALPPTATVAVGYMQNGSVRLTQNFTTDHDAAGKALRIPMGADAGGNSPYLSITDVVKRWPESKSRHAIFMISDGIDPLQPGTMDPYLDQSIETAQRTGTQLYAIFAARSGHFGHSLWRINQGQNNLSELTDKTGGESYFQGLDTPVSFSPFLREFTERLNHQYRLTFSIKPDKRPTYKHVKLQTEVPNAELVAADQVYIPAAK